MEGSAGIKLCSAAENDFQAKNMNDDDSIKKPNIGKYENGLIMMVQQNEM